MKDEPTDSLSSLPVVTKNIATTGGSAISSESSLDDFGTCSSYAEWAAQWDKWCVQYRKERQEMAQHRLLQHCQCAFCFTHVSREESDSCEYASAEDPKPHDRNGDYFAKQRPHTYLTTDTTSHASFAFTGSLV